MKKKIYVYTLGLAALFFVSTGLHAQDQQGMQKKQEQEGMQEQIEVSVKVKKDGKVVKDTTYMFDDASEAKHAVKMMEVISGDDEHMEHITIDYTSAHKGGGEAKTMVFVSEDGKTTEIKEIHKDSVVWVTEKEMDGDQVKVIKYQIDEGEKAHGEHVVIMKGEDGNTFDILVEEGLEEGDVVKKKEVKVMVADDDDVKWHVEGDEMIYDKDKNVYIIKGDEDVKVKIEKIMEEDDAEKVKVIVIKEVDEDGDHDEDHDEDVDHDVDHDHDTDMDEEVEVKVVKKKEKK